MKTGLFVLFTFLFFGAQVLATDGFFTATTQVTVDILDDNDNRPYCLQQRYLEQVY